MTTPRVSITIPNFNNGRASSKDGVTDLIGDLLQSLHDTLKEDPTPLEILAFDDGSTDDSLQTLRDWSGRTWRGGEPFLKLTEAEHCGVLSITANKLVHQSRGEIVVRLDGDIVVHTKDWAEKLCAVFDQGPPDLGVIGPKQLAPNGTVHAMGDFLLHPKGYHHMAAGLPSSMVIRPIEVDHVMGCFYCFKRKVYDELEGFDEAFLRGQTVDFGMRSRLAGYRCWAVPHLVFTHRHTVRGSRRATTADTDQGIDTSRQTFFDKWGFDRIAPDLDVVRERYAGTPLLWNGNVWGAPSGFGEVPASAPPGAFERSVWVRFNNDSTFQGWAETKVGTALQIHREGLAQDDRPIVVLGCGSGVAVHLLAMQGVRAVGVEREPGHIDLARQIATQTDERNNYPGPPPQYLQMTDPRRAPLDAGCAAMVCIFDRMEAHPNPVALLKEATRLTGPTGVILVISKCPDLIHDAPLSPYRRYTPQELSMQVKAATDRPTVMEWLKDRPGRPIVVLARPEEAQEPALSASPAAAASG
ncbi:MAG: glycosyltransferase [Planctomycetota bacterium]